MAVDYAQFVLDLIGVTTEGAELVEARLPVPSWATGAVLQVVDTGGGRREVATFHVPHLTGRPVDFEHAQRERDIAVAIAAFIRGFVVADAPGALAAPEELRKLRDLCGVVADAVLERFTGAVTRRWSTDPENPLEVVEREAARLLKQTPEPSTLVVDLRGHRYTATLNTSRRGLHSGRPTYFVGCATCRTTVHAATTSTSPTYWERVHLDDVDSNDSLARRVGMPGPTR
jgi:hypothetical protein